MSTATLNTGRIGPNAINRVAEVLAARVGSCAAWDLFEDAGLVQHVRHPPEDMVPEEEVRQLHAALRRALGPDVARQVAVAAGRRTADYLLARRIPQPVQALLKRLPARLASPLLLAAIRRNAWTFVGSGRYTAQAGRPVVLTIQDNPLCRGVAADTPACDYYAATFERLYQVLVHRDAVVTEVACEACGDDACRFEIRW